mmetsp:Transcript_9155/g.22952  ORF Transcript_9155/g.22952 Transcript_9155/m.22952 type:complete len:261 (-) Transcript_9155:1429-2211(-)
MGAGGGGLRATARATGGGRARQLADQPVVAATGGHDVAPCAAVQHLEGHGVAVVGVVVNHTHVEDDPVHRHLQRLQIGVETLQLVEGTPAAAIQTLREQWPQFVAKHVEQWPLDLDEAAQAMYILHTHREWRLLEFLLDPHPFASPQLFQHVVDGGHVLFRDAALCECRIHQCKVVDPDAERAQVGTEGAHHLADHGEQLCFGQLQVGSARCHNVKVRLVVFARWCRVPVNLGQLAATQRTHVVVHQEARKREGEIIGKQ